MKMRSLKYLFPIAALVLSLSSCEKFLNVTPIDALSGNNFWKTKADAEGYANGIYMKLRNKIGREMLFPTIDIRSNFVRIAVNLDNNGNAPINNLINHNLNPVVSGTTTYDDRLKSVMTWKGWYDVIAASNILYAEVANIPSNQISETERKRYQAEATFTRNLSYMYICKLFGDAIYYTDAYHSEALARTPQLEVVKKCITDMLSVKDNLPVKYDDSSLMGIRPTRASAVALLMHLNMWAAAWENGDKTPYYKAVLDLSEELASYKDYYLLPVSTENTKRIFKGRSPENLFSILQEYNYGETFESFANYSFFFSHYPYRGNSSKTESYMTYEKEYIDKLFPVSATDLRRITWFERIDANGGAFQFKKYMNTYSTGTGSAVTMNSDDCATVFRLADAFLLVAEAAAEMNDETKAKEYLNSVRLNAGAAAFVGAGQDLKDEIFRERCRELIGEGQFYFDLVRTKRVISSDFSKTAMSVGNFNSGAWTFPLIISSDERSANPNLNGNTFWN
jgi:hypothetical protein